MTAPFRILVTGSRHCTDEQAELVAACLEGVVRGEWVHTGKRPVVVVHGRCPYGGVDLAAHRWAERFDGATPEPVPADWSRHGKAAGVIRNGEMVSHGADICLAFPAKDSRGTWDCIRKVADAGIRVHIEPLVGA